MKNAFFNIAAIISLATSPVICQAAMEEATPLVIEGMANPMTTLLTIAKVLGAFLLVAGLMALAFKLMKRLGVGSSAASGGLISVLETRALAPKKYISLVQIGNKQLAVGISEQHISLLCQLDEPLAQPVAEQPQQGNFANMLNKMAKKEEKGNV